MPNYSSQKVSFENEEGRKLSGRMEFPADQQPFAFVIFAHCFTCNKNLGAVRNISRALTSHGFGVLRFDFTGLGESEGDFADTTFSSNVQDLVAASQFLEEEYQAPALLIGHSLGGAAVIYAAAQLEAVKAVVTIGAPADPEHVSHLLEGGLEQLEKEGETEVNIGGRPFRIRKQFLEDIRKKDMASLLEDLRKPLLLMHSPQDRTVEIENAAKIYHAAFHPKSFITLDGADHLLSQKSDSQYAGNMIAGWVQRYLPTPEKEDWKTPSEVAARLGAEGFTTEIRAGSHALLADEPESVGGNAFGPTPYDFLSAGLASCTAMTVQMYARRKKWPLDEIITHVDHDKVHAEDCENSDQEKSKIDRFQLRIELTGDLSPEQRDRLLEIAGRCPVHRTLKEHDIKIEIEVPS